MDITKEELKKFLKFIDRYEYSYDANCYDMVVDDYLNFLNASSQHETSKVGTNKEAKEVCDCEFRNSCSARTSHICMTDKCGDYVKQTG